jgi:cold shock CspA family protein
MTEPRDEKRYTGKIIKLSEKGYGFISTREMEFTRIFFHWTSLQQDSPKFPNLSIGMPVEFSAQEIPTKGWRALRIKVIKGE